jgi:hypothetical protein
MTFPSPLIRPFFNFSLYTLPSASRFSESCVLVFISLFHMYSCPVFPPCVLPSVVICFHVFTDSFLGFYITYMTVYHVHQSEYRLGSVPSTSEPRSLAFGSPPALPFAPALPTQTPRLTVELSGSPSPLDPRFIPPFAFPRARNLTVAPATSPTANAAHHS